MKVEAGAPKGVLYIVATPIGNLEDMTFRGVRVLREADLIAAEDTRHSRKLLTHFGISRPITSYFDHNKGFKGAYLLGKLREGLTIALISDAGTPCISDPGYQLVRDAVAEGITVIPVPGASALVAALSAAGLPTDRFAFEGFLPAREGKRRERLSALRQEQRVMVFYEAPGRLEATLRTMLEVLGERRVAIARELTKIHEEFKRGGLGDILAELSGQRIRGEVVVMVSPAEDVAEPGEVPVAELLIRYVEEDGLSMKDAVKRVAMETGLPRSVVYGEALGLKKGD